MTGGCQIRTAAVLAIVVALLSGCMLETLNRSESLNPSGILEEDSDVGRTFDNAVVALPGVAGDDVLVTRMNAADMAPRLRRLAPHGRLPTVVYMHGCNGLGDQATIEALARRGFAVIAPNSLARTFRPLQCRPSEKIGGFNLYVYDFRLVELSYALHRMAALPWIDTSNLFLVGISEGGVAAALYRGRAFRARVIAQWSCHGIPLIRGIAAPPDEPILAIVQADDPYYDSSRTQGQAGDCGSFFGDRPRSRSIVLTDPGIHSVLGDAATRRRIVEFIAAERRRGD